MSFGNEFSAVQDLSSLSNTDLIEAYQKVLKYYKEQKESIEKSKQRIYTLEQDKILKDKILEDFKEELQGLTDYHDREIEKIKVDSSNENKELHSRLTELYLTIQKLELENEHLKCDLETANKKTQAAPSLEKKCREESEIIISKERFEHLEKIEDDHRTLIDEIVNLKDELFRVTSELTQKKVTCTYSMKSMVIFMSF